LAYPEPLERLVAAFERFPGVGRRTAERLAFHALRDARARELGPALEHAVRNTKLCGTCFNVTENDPCPVCSDDKRDTTSVCVVEQPKDVETMERAGVFEGRYHVLMGALNPAEGSDPEHLFVKRLIERVRAGGIDEVILATDPDAEGEATALLVLEALDSAGLTPRVTRMARGMPAGSAIEYLHKGVLEDALEGRREMTLRRRP
jgi:recombination protein RecR